ncbi:hypothetical protein BDV38DRAFT_286586 [Aspergillus pseudotamarii]|uniref:Uncharacterized protein n=1 Tax=Aspergillus pseudotamarii TaxID=132259 RepID=A0A5N6SIF3_ASPPS|nr:uncharacterized protein BDV38DRAFT_286586 [Aspergillus pseudotamarii]KAE8133687.1 hypothetical protein BDV38DRAFT_286586 [Aspergillus pseudotamarii]
MLLGFRWNPHQSDKGVPLGLYLLYLSRGPITPRYSKPMGLQLNEALATPTSSTSCASHKEPWDSQSVEKILSDLIISSATDAVSTEASHLGNVEGKLFTDSPLHDQERYDDKVSFRALYELKRVSSMWNVSIGALVQGHEIPDDYILFRKWLTGHPMRDGQPLPAPPKKRAWDVAEGCWMEPESQQSVELSGSLLRAPCVQGHFILKLNPLKLEKGCRLYRRFGSDRFLTLTIPFLEKFCGCNRLREHIAEWLAGSQHRLLGRI